MSADNNNGIEKLRELLARQDDIRLSIVFGSVASNSQTPESDLDIAVLSNGPLTTRRRQTLIESLAKVCHRPVDLIDLSTVGEPLLGQILQQGQRLTGTDSSWATLVTRHLFDAADFLPYRNRMLKERREAWTKQ
jgi:predicted nucleotidyltransferase